MAVSSVLHIGFSTVCLRSCNTIVKWLPQTGGVWVEAVLGLTSRVLLSIGVLLYRLFRVGIKYPLHPLFMCTESVYYLNSKRIVTKTALPMCVCVLTIPNYNSVCVGSVPSVCGVHYSLPRQPLTETPLVIRHSLSSPLQSPSHSHSASISTSSQRKVTFNDPDVVLELGPALTVSAGCKGEAAFVPAFPVTLN